MLHYSSPPHYPPTVLQHIAEHTAYWGNNETAGLVEDAVSLNGTLSKKDLKRRRVLLCFAAILAVFTLLGLSLTFKQQTHIPLMMATLLTLLATGVTTMVVILCKLPLSDRFILTIIAITCLCIYISDLSTRLIHVVSWPLLIGVIDLLLVMEMSPNYTLTVVGITAVWLLFTAFEETFRFGLFDLPGLRPQSGEFGRDVYFTELTNCEKVPCASKHAASGVVGSMAVFLMDFIVTRGFARDVLAEQASMERTINVVQEIAGLLAGYDVEGVARMLDSERQLPEAMHASLRRMEQNLRKYRPYLPAALFEEEEEDAQRLSVIPPGVASEVATVVFTDIRSSTWIWQHAPDGMRPALRIHNTIMRATMLSFGGYEVKTIGDAFMVAFSSTQHGIEFGLRVHELLREADWPASLLENAPICAKQGALWCGLTVRIGVNSGPVSIDSSTLTGRIDYFGHTVNVASRLESICTPGAVAVRTDLWSAECGAISAVVGASEALDLKGVSGTTFVCCVWPVSLGGRQHTKLIECTIPIRKAEKCDSGSTHSFSNSESSGVLPATHRCFEATLGVLDVDVGDEGNTAVMQTMSNALSTLTVALDQSGGTVVAMVGNRVHVGWNLTRSAPAHTENAIRFAQRALSGVPLAGMAMVSGTVQYGTVGARKQRFVTVMGATVRRAAALCDDAVRLGARCLYEPPQHATMPATLQNVTTVFKELAGVYEVQSLSGSAV